MSIVVADNFQYKGGKPLDARMKFASVSDMVGTSAADLYDGCFAYVTGTKKYYSYDSSNALDPTLGKWREFSAGTEYSDFTGATSQEAGAHGLVPAPTTGDISKFLKGDGTWATVPIPSFDYSNTSPEAMNFSTDEKVIGTWIDGKPLYQKTVYIPSLPNNDNGNYAHNVSNMDKCVYASGFFIDVYEGAPHYHYLNYTTTVPAQYGNQFNIFVDADRTNIVVGTGYDRSAWSGYVTLKYTKTTDSPVASGEKIVGQWVDGKPVYEKIITDTFPVSTSETPTDKEINLSSVNIDWLVSVNATINANGTPPIPAYIGTGISITGNVFYSNNKLVLRNQNQQNYNGATTYITIRYTKTTD